MQLPSGGNTSNRMTSVSLSMLSDPYYVNITPQNVWASQFKERNLPGADSSTHPKEWPCRNKNALELDDRTQTLLYLCH